MCGIAGIFHLNGEGISESILRRLTDSMQHRGPDGSGYTLLHNDTLGLGQRRLSILDLSEAAAQPMSYAGNTLWITYNGELFNFAEIRQTLQSMGYAFRTDSDTEVILASYKAWGKECLHRFNGMWAFAIWDEERQELFLARDRFGIKPLYYLFEEGKRFVFASETRAFKFLEGFSRSFHRERLQLNLSDPYALEGLGHTVFDKLFQLLPGHYICIRQNAAPQQKRWWDIQEHRVTVPHSPEAQAEKFYELFRDACRLRLISDVPVGTALSGGLDSTAVYSTVFDILKNETPGRVSPNSQRAFTAVFPGLPNDEKIYAERAAAYTGGPIVFLESETAQLAERIEKETELCDFINVSPITSISEVYRGMRRHGVTVSLDGHGADEMLYGYRDMVYALYNHALWYGSLPEAEEYRSVLQNMVHADYSEEMQRRFQHDMLEKSRRESSLLQKLKKPFAKNRSDLEYLPFDLPQLSDRPYDFSRMPLPDRMVHNEFFQHTLPALLRNFDRAGMINNIEIRMPFMDWRLVTYVYSLPLSSKIGRGFTKLIVREAMKQRMDETLRTRTFKVGIASPVDVWLNGPLQSWSMDSIRESKLRTMAEEQLKKQGSWNKDMVREIWQHINTELIRG